MGMFSDDRLFSELVLKGGNALNLVHDLPGRTSIDIDLSIAGDFPDNELEQIGDRIFRALDTQFATAGFAVFDVRFSKKPKDTSRNLNPNWGGYLVEFKLIERETFHTLAGREQEMRMAAIAVEPGGGRIFTVDISKHEFCEPKVQAQLNDTVIYVYTLPMLAVEKLRAICQQLPDYRLRGYKIPRARDFYDITRIVRDRGIDLTLAEHRSLFAPIFAAKDVPLSFLSLVAAQREFHRADWDSVVNSATEKLTERDYDQYFDFVLSEIKKLHAVGVK